jgi:hypothetical protein
MKALKAFLKHCDVAQGRTLIVGSKIHEGTDKQDRRELYPDAIGVDMEEGLGVDRVLNLEEPLPDDFEAFAHIECTSVLEHSRRPWALAANLELSLVEGGTILVMVPWVWRVHDYPGDFFRYTQEGIESLFPSIIWERSKYIVENRLVKSVPKITYRGTRFIARSEMILFGRRCASIS